MSALYKVTGPAGEPLHGGAGAWPLPANGQPGAWREVEGEIAKCQRGLHLTDDPARWWRPGCTIYLAEAEGIIGSCGDEPDRKVVCRRARLLREASAEELTALRIFTAGEHRVSGTDVAVALGSSSVVARGSSRVVAWGSSSVVARGSSRVVARGSSRVEAWGSSSVEAWGWSSVEAWGSSRVEAWESSSVEAWESVTVVSWRGKPGVRIAERAVWIERGGETGAPKIHVAKRTRARRPNGRKKA